MNTCAGTADTGARGLIGIAPGVDLERDILSQMSFRPVMQEPVPVIDARIFIDEPMGLREQLLLPSPSDSSKSPDSRAELWSHPT